MPGTQDPTSLNGTPPTDEALRSVGHAIDHAGDKVETAVEKATGLSGKLGQYAAFGVVGVTMAVTMGASSFFMWQIDKANSRMDALVRDMKIEAKDNRDLFREEAKDQRMKSWENTKLLRDGLDGVKRAVEVNTEAVQKTGKDSAEVHKATLEEIRKIVKDHE
jgi:hydroxylamine reductase (hybrid-cluster protein)